jgi:hypothetical protein
MERAGQRVDLNLFPNADFCFKMVAKVDGNCFSIYDAKVEYEIGQALHEPVKRGKQGGYFVYAEVENAIFADIMYHHGGLYHAPRTILKCICWGADSPYRYGSKLCYSNILPVQDLGLPMGYKANPRDAIEQMLKDKSIRHHKKLEIAHDLGLIKRNNFSKEYHFNNVFENYFSESVVAGIEKLLKNDKLEA